MLREPVSINLNSTDSSNGDTTANKNDSQSGVCLSDHSSSNEGSCKLHGVAMIVCSCNIIDSEKIRAAAQSVGEPNERLVLNMMNWQPECSCCTKVLVAEIRKILGEIEWKTKNQ